MNLPRTVCRFTLAGLALIVLMGQGCPPVTLPQINLGNAVPTANAGPDQTLALGQTAVLDASGSSDTDGDSLSYSWTQTYGTAVVLTGEHSMYPSLTAGAMGVCEFTLTVSDGRGGADVDTVRVTVTD